MATGTGAAVLARTRRSPARRLALGRPRRARRPGFGPHDRGPLVVRRIIDDATDGASSGEIARLAVRELVVAVAAQVLAVVVVWLATLAAWRTTNELRLR